ncbi:MAG: hypothetical protein IKN12_03680 [Selenomonadaceae bacterium]|nr:hypothetical protein [Selenomonadaceae bacterium]
MLYPFISYPDGTEIVHSEIYPGDDGDLSAVRVEVETPNNETGRFKNLQIILPSGKVKIAEGFTLREIEHYKKRIMALSDVIFENAADNMKLYS